MMYIHQQSTGIPCYSFWMPQLMLIALKVILNMKMNHQLTYRVIMFSRLASKTMAEMSQIAKERSYQVSGCNEDSFDTFGKFVASKLRSINTECNNPYFVRQAKRKMQHILTDTWDTVESGSTLSSSGTSIQSYANTPTIILHDASGLSHDVIANAIQLSNLSDNAFSDNETGQ